MRRLIVEEPPAATAAWSSRLGWFAVAVVAIAVLVARGDQVERMAIAAVVAVGVGLALVALVLALVAFVVIWREGRRGVGSAVAGFVLAAIVLVLPSVMVVRFATLPRINDVTTDIADPPSFSRSRAALAARRDRTPPDPPRETRDLQRAAYPGLAPIMVDREPAEALDIVRQAVTALGMRVVEVVPPGGRSGAGRLEAVAETRGLRFADDVTIRLKPFAAGTRVDVRSASRVGAHDFGANAARIMRLAEEIKTLNENR